MWPIVHFQNRWNSKLWLANNYDFVHLIPIKFDASQWERTTHVWVVEHEILHSFEDVYFTKYFIYVCAQVSHNR